MSGTALVLSFSAGMLVGAAAMVSLTYRACLGGYVILLCGLSALGIPCNGLVCDLLLMAGALLVCFGVARGLIALCYGEGGKENAG